MKESGRKAVEMTKEESKKEPPSNHSSSDGAPKPQPSAKGTEECSNPPSEAGKTSLTNGAPREVPETSQEPAMAANGGEARSSAPAKDASANNAVPEPPISGKFAPTVDRTSNLVVSQLKKPPVPQTVASSMAPAAATKPPPSEQTATQKSPPARQAQEQRRSLLNMPPAPAKHPGALANSHPVAKPNVTVNVVDRHIRPPQNHPVAHSTHRKPPPRQEKMHPVAAVHPKNGSMAAPEVQHAHPPPRATLQPRQLPHAGAPVMGTVQDYTKHSPTSRSGRSKKDLKEKDTKHPISDHDIVFSPTQITTNAPHLLESVVEAYHPVFFDKDGSINKNHNSNRTVVAVIEQLIEKHKPNLYATYMDRTWKRLSYQDILPAGAFSQRMNSMVRRCFVSTKKKTDKECEPLLCNEEMPPYMDPVPYFYQPRPSAVPHRHLPNILPRMAGRRLPTSPVPTRALPRKAVGPGTHAKHGGPRTPCRGRIKPLAHIDMDKTPVMANTTFTKNGGASEIGIPMDIDADEDPWTSTRKKRSGKRKDLAKQSSSISLRPQIEKPVVQVEDLAYDWAPLGLGVTTGTAAWNRRLQDQMLQDPGAHPSFEPVTAVDTLRIVQGLRRSLVTILPPRDSPLHRAAQARSGDQIKFGDEVPEELRPMMPRWAEAYRGMLAQDCDDGLEHRREYQYRTSDEVRECLMRAEQDAADLAAREGRILKTVKHLGLWDSPKSIVDDAEGVDNPSQGSEKVFWQEDFEALVKKGGPDYRHLKIHDRF